MGVVSTEDIFLLGEEEEESDADPLKRHAMTKAKVVRLRVVCKRLAEDDLVVGDVSCCRLFVISVAVSSQAFSCLLHTMEI